MHASHFVSFTYLLLKTTVSNLIFLLQLLINEGYDVSVADREHQTPVDWADAMGQHSCMNYLLMVELCYKLSRNVLLLTHQVEMYDIKLVAKACLMIIESLQIAATE